MNTKDNSKGTLVYQEKSRAKFSTKIGKGLILAKKLLDTSINTTTQTKAFQTHTLSAEAKAASEGSMSALRTNESVEVSAPMS